MKFAASISKATKETKVTKDNKAVKTHANH